MIKLFFSVCLLFIFQNAIYGQLKIDFLYNEKSNKDSFYFKIRKTLNTLTPLEPRPYLESKVNAFGINNGNAKTTVLYNIADTSICFFADLWGKAVIVIPNDSVSIKFRKRDLKTEGMVVNEKFPITWIHEFEYEGKNKYIYQLIDSLTFHTGYFTHFWIQFSQVNYDINKFYDTLTCVYQKRINFIDGYCRKYNISSRINQLIKAECYAAYIFNLTFSLPTENGKLPIKYTTTLDKVKFDDTKILKTTNYYDAILRYFEKYKVAHLKKIRNPEKVFKLTYKTLGDSFSNPKTAETLQSWCLIINLDKNKNFSCFPEIYTQFKKKYPTSLRLPIIDSLMKEVLKKQSLVLDSVLIHTKLLDTNLNEISLKTVLEEKKLTLIDCWATWCKPCIKEIPYVNEIKKDYKDKLKIIYLSFDRNIEDWINKQKELNISENTFFLLNNFESIFASYFDIGSIPRYILIDKNGIIVSNSFHRPSNPNFKKQIEEYLRAEFK